MLSRSPPRLARSSSACARRRTSSGWIACPSARPRPASETRTTACRWAARSRPRGRGSRSYGYPTSDPGSLCRVGGFRAELSRIGVERVVNVLIRLGSRNCAGIDRRGQEEREHIATPVMLAFPHHRAHELLHLDSDRGFLEHLPRRRLLEGLACFVVAGGKLPVHAVRAARANHEQTPIVQDDPAGSRERRPGHTALSQAPHASS